MTFEELDIECYLIEKYCKHCEHYGNCDDKRCTKKGKYEYAKPKRL